MDNLSVETSPQRNKQSNWLRISLRLLGGALFGYVISFSFLFWSDTGNLSLLGWAL